MSAHLLMACRQMQADLPFHLDRLASLGVTFECPQVDQQLSEDELLGMIDRFDGMIAGDDEVTAAVFDRGWPKLRVVSKWGVGVDAIDQDAATRLGIVVTNTPGVFDDEVADVVLGYLLMLLRGLHRIDRAVREGTWLKIEGRSASSLTLGVVGVGGIGRAVARRGRVIGMNVLGYDASEVSRSLAAADGVHMTEFDDLLKAADVVSINCPLTPSTLRLFSYREFALMRSGAYIINTSRGRVIDQPALVEALATGKLAGAALDVTEEEPLPAGDPLRGFENVILGSHNASNTREAVRRTSERALENLLRELKLA